MKVTEGGGSIPRGATAEHKYIDFTKRGDLKFGHERVGIPAVQRA